MEVEEAGEDHQEVDPGEEVYHLGVDLVTGVLVVAVDLVEVDEGAVVTAGSQEMTGPIGHHLTAEVGVEVLEDVEDSALVILEEGGQETVMSEEVAWIEEAGVEVVGALVKDLLVMALRHLGRDQDTMELPILMLMDILQGVMVPLMPVVIIRVEVVMEVVILHQLATMAALTITADILFLLPLLRGITTRTLTLNQNTMKIPMVLVEATEMALMALLSPAGMRIVLISHRTMTHLVMVSMMLQLAVIMVLHQVMDKAGIILANPVQDIRHLTETMQLRK